MERVAKLLKDFDLGAALVRLWVMAGDAQRLNEWEQRLNLSTFDANMKAFCLQIESGTALKVADMESQPLALIRALDTTFAIKQDLDRPSDEAYEEDGKLYWLIPQHLDWRATTRVKQQQGNRQKYFTYFIVIPERTPDGQHVELYVSKGRIAEGLSHLKKQGNAQLKIWIAHFTDTADVRWDKSSPSGNWRTTEVTPTATRLASLVSQLTQAVKAGAHIVVFPEFSLDIEQREAVLRWIKTNEHPQLLYIIPGSFHEECGENKFFNTAPLIQNDARVVFTHQKLSLFSGADVGECVSTGNTLHVLVTPIGCMTILICKDFMDDGPNICNLLKHVLVDWVFVPSFGNLATIKAHKKRAKSLAAVVSGTNSAVANTRNSAMDVPHEPVGKSIPGFGYRSQTNEALDVPVTGGLVEFPLAKPIPTIKTSTPEKKSDEKGKPTLFRIK